MWVFWYKDRLDHGSTEVAAAAEEEPPAENADAAGPATEAGADDDLVMTTEEGPTSALGALARLRAAREAKRLQDNTNNDDDIVMPTSDEAAPSRTEAPVEGDGEVWGVWWRTISTTQIDLSPTQYFDRLGAVAEDDF